jgi:hypothetical protein
MYTVTQIVFLIVLVFSFLYYLSGIAFKGKKGSFKPGNVITDPVGQNIMSTLSMWYL